MPRKRTSMTKTREIIRLKEQVGLSRRKIAQVVGVSRPVVSQIIDQFDQAAVNYDSLRTLSDTELKELLKQSPDRVISSKSDDLKAKFPHYAKELKRTGVTLRLLWEEYLAETPEGLRYTQFCYHFKQWKSDQKVSLHMDYKAGDKMMVDYAGEKMHIVSKETGKKIPVEVFVAILPASQLTYVEAVMSQNQESFMRSNERAIRYFGGVTSAIVPDNLKSGVLKADLYEPVLNPLFADFAEYYRTAVVPARARKPKDKSPVEGMVRIAYTRIYAPLRDKVFYSLEELNQAILEKLEDHNNKPMDKMKVSRRELFNAVEKKALKSLPLAAYPLKKFQYNSTVHIDYHVMLKEDKHYYSVPHFLRGKKVKVIYDDRNVAIYHDNIRIVQHQRNCSTHKYTTLQDHMPPNHRFESDWNPDKLKWWAGNIGDDTKRAIEYILDSKPYPEQAYKSCLGVLSLAKKYGHDVLNFACRKAWNMQRVYYQFIKEQAVSIHEQKEREMDKKQLCLIPGDHENIRGQEYYQ